MRVFAAIGVGAASLAMGSSGVAVAASAQRFRVTYVGAGAWSTTYHSTPANPGGNPDTNDAHDSSSQRWSLTFVEPLTWHAGARGLRMLQLDGARGITHATGQIAHNHRDGLYAFDDASISCQVAFSTPADRRLSAVLVATYLPSSRRLRLIAFNPVSEALSLLPQQCPGQGDSLDGLSDNYFTPGFSFASGYGPDRWFRSRPVLIPLAVLRRAAALTIHVGPAPNGAPRADCAVPDPAWQRCRTGGSWQGTLTLHRLP
jgi:hypothetical protein